jgi:hypothetical protein
MTTLPLDTIPPSKERLPHSTYGIWSFRLAFFATVVQIASFVAFRATDHRLEAYEYMLWLMFLALCNWGSCLVAFVTFILGIVGLFQYRTRKVFPVLGLIFSFGPFLIEIIYLIQPPAVWAIIRWCDKLQVFF